MTSLYCAKASQINDFEPQFGRDGELGGDPVAATEQAEPCQAAAHLRRQRRFSHGA
jgi:hypothetical protein